MATTKSTALLEDRFTSGSLARNLLDLSWPSMLSMALSSIPNTLDAVWIGQLGSEALAAAGIGMALRVTMISPLMALSTAGGAVVARYIGAKDQARANLAVLQSVILFVLVSGTIGLLGLAFAEPLLRLAGATGQVLPLATRYVRVLFVGLIAMEMVPSIGFMLVSAGSPQLSLRVNLLASGIMLVGEPLLVLGVGDWPGLGVMGASLAMVLANTVGMFYALYLLLKRRASAWIDLEHLSLNWPMMSRILRIALPAVIQRGTPNLANSILLRIVSAYGTVPLAAFSVVNKLFNLALIPAMGISRSAAALVGQNLGARQAERAERGGWYTGLAVLAISALTIGLTVALGEPLLGLFTQEPGVLAEGLDAMLVLGLGSVFYAVSLAFEGCLNGAGDTVSAMAINILFLWVVQIPLVYLFAEATAWGAQGIWWAVGISRVARAAMTWARFQQGHWKHREI